jgi:pyruvate kinase
MMKILVTVGPASEDQHSLNEFAKKTKLFRLNGSHGTIEWHKKAVYSIRKACPDAFILMDIPGVKPRTNNINDIKICKGQEVVFGDATSDEHRLAIALTKQLPKHDKKLTNFSVNDGQFVFDFIDFDDGYVVGRSRSDFILLPKKGINLPGSIYDEVQQFEIYENFIKNVTDMDIDGLGLSFVQTGDLVNKVRKVAPSLVLISKVENSEGLRNCVEIIKYSDAIMIDRGDLSAEIGLNDLYGAIEIISGNTKAHGKPLIMATENLETMVNREVPSKSEVMSIAHSASLGVDCIMLSEETATASSGQGIVTWLNEFLHSCFGVDRQKFSSTIKNKFPGVWAALADFEPMPVLLMTKSGYALFDYFSVKPEGEAVLVTDNPKIIKISSLFANKITIIPIEIVGNAPLELIWNVIEHNKENLFALSDQLVAIYVSKYVSTARANCITIFDKSDFYI